MMRAPRSLLAAAAAVLVSLPAAGSAVAGDDDGVEAARAGLAAYLVDHRPASPSDSSEIAGCPAIDLERFQTALDDNAVPGDPIGGWSTEIEWDEWQEIDPELMSVVCAGDADGDAHDGDVRLGAAIAVIDAGSEERALEVEQMVGFGTLDAEPADVPGGEVMATCVDWDGLAVCVTLWSQDGFVVATLLSSDELDIPDGAGTAVLEDVLDDVLVTLAAYEPSDASGSTAPTSPATGADASESGSGAGLLDTAAASAGLASRLSGVEQISELEPLGDCPVVERDAVVEALETAGVDTPIESLLAEQGPSLTNGTTWHAVGLVCTGSYIGVEDDESFPELRISVVVANFGDTDTFRTFLDDAHPGIDVDDALATPTIGGGSIGECAHVDRTEQCAEYWEQGGFLVGVRIADRVFIDRPTSSAVLVALVPLIVESLAAEAVAAPGPGVTLPAGVLDAARAQLAALSSDAEPVECPFVDQLAIDVALADAGIDLVTDEWSAVASEGAGGAVAGLACAGRSGRSAIRVEVLDFGASDAAQDVIELVHGCEKVGDTEYCVETWEQDGLTVTVSVTAVGTDIEQPAVRALVDALAPVVLEHLAGS